MPSGHTGEQRHAMSMPHMDESGSRKRKRQANDTSSHKGQRCIDQFFSPGLAKCSPAAPADRAAIPEDDRPQATVGQSCQVNATLVLSTSNQGLRKQPAHKLQTGPQQLPDRATLCSNSHEQHNGNMCSNASLHGSKSTLRKDTKAIPFKTAPAFGKVSQANRVPSLGPSAEPSTDAQQRLFEDFASFQAALTDRQQFRE